jgi:hypothetical protein
LIGLLIVLDCSGIEKSADVLTNDFEGENAILDLIKS